MAIKLSDIQSSAIKAHPHFEIEFEVKTGEDVEVKELTFSNIVMTPEKDRPRIAKELGSIMQEKVSAEEKKAKASAFRTLSNRIEKALYELTQDKATFAELIEVLDKDSSEYDAYMLALVAAYMEETRLGEASASENS